MPNGIKNKSILDNKPSPLLDLKLSRPQGQIIFQPLLNLSENGSLVTCITNLSRIHEKLIKPTRSAILNFFNHYQTFLRNAFTWITNLIRIFEKLFKLLRPQIQILAIKCKKSQLIGHYEFFSSHYRTCRELLITNMHNKFQQDTWKTFQVITPTRSNYWRKMWKITINRPFLIFFTSLLNLSENWSLVTYITHLGRIHGKLFKLSCPNVKAHIF